jgi:hypothetical protein
MVHNWKCLDSALQTKVISKKYYFLTFSMLRGYEFFSVNILNFSDGVLYRQKLYIFKVFCKL